MKQNYCINYGGKLGNNEKFCRQCGKEKKAK